MLNTAPIRRLIAPQSRYVRYAALVLSALLLGGCDIFGDLFGRPNPTPSISKPATLNPEADAFLLADTRSYYWVDALRRSGKTDSAFLTKSFDVTHTGDTVLGGSQRPFLDVSEDFTTAAPAALFSRLGFRSTAIHYDTALVLDPGPAYRFPDTPAVGWRLDTLTGDYRFVRVLKGTAVLEQSGKRFETWAFAESTWWNQGTPVLVSTGNTWMGATGLVRHESLWTGFVTFSGETGSLFRRINAL